MAVLQTPPTAEHRPEEDMPRTLSACFRPVLIAGAVCLVLGAARAGVEPSSDKLGTKIANVTFKDAAGKATALHDITDKKAVVVVTFNFDCPNSTGYAPTLAEMAKTYGDKGIAFVGVCPTDDDDAASIAKKAAEYKMGFPFYKDDKGAAVEALKAAITPEVFVLDHNFVLRYRGRIDDGYSARLKKNRNITHHDLKNALDELLAGKAVGTPLTKAVGCPIDLEKRVSKDGKVTYYRDVLPILQNNCQNCHRPGEVGPFSLMTYKQAVTWASDLKDYTKSRQMPPWKIVEGVGFYNERRLSDKDIATLATWADNGTPEGDAKDAPKPKEFVTGWMHGKPDLVLEPEGDFVVGPGGRDMFRCFVLPTKLTEDRYVVAVEVKPSNPRVVHHTLNFIDSLGRGRKLEETAQANEKGKKADEYDRGPGYSMAMGVGFTPNGALSGWAPGQLGYRLPEGYGWHMPAGSDVIMQVHYHRDGRVEKDRTQIGLYFAKKGATVKPFKGGVIAGQFPRVGLFPGIPANDEHCAVHGSIPVNEDCTLYSVMPHMHLVGKEIKVTLKPAGGEKKTLLAIKDWDYNWQETYFLTEPLKLKVGDMLEVDAVYDNSSKNANNPNDPPKSVFIGEQTTNEMCFVFLGATSDKATRSPFGRPNIAGRPQETPEKK
jgi:peroxiredoxin/mono/diheme cytochrome c family protein